MSLSAQQIAQLRAARNIDDWKVVESAIERGNGGKWPDDFFRRVYAGGVARNTMKTWSGKLSDDLRGAVPRGRPGEDTEPVRAKGKP